MLSAYPSLLLEGDCVSFYPNGKRESLATYENNNKVGLEYYYFPSGGIYWVKKYIFNGHPFRSTILEWECHDTKGMVTATEGNGHWIVYDSEYHIIIQGEVKNGIRVGQWTGFATEMDSVRFTYNYDNGKVLSAAGYDKKGVAHPFTRAKEMANYKGGPITFVKIFNNHLALPRGPDGKKMSVDTVHISFVVEADGHLDQIKPLGNIDPLLTAALTEAITKCKDWYPGLYYGIPVRTRVVLPLSFLHGYDSDARTSPYEEEMVFSEKVLGY